MSNLSSDADIRIFCALCDYFTISSLDIDSKARCGVCRYCELEIVQPNRDKWITGWRPEDKEILLHKEKIKNRVFPILKNIHNYF